MNELGFSAVKVLLPIAVVLAGCYLILCALLYFAQSALVYHPSRSMVSTPGDEGYTYEEIHYRTSDGVSISAWFIPAPAAAINGPSKGAVLFCHGNAGNISHRLATIGFFNRLGLSTLIFDYRGYGKSEGKPSEQGTYLDAQGAWKVLVEQKGFQPGEIIIAGRSLGGAAAAWLTARLQSQGIQPRALVVESSFASVPELGAHLYPFLPVRWLTRFKYDTKAYVKERSCPLLVIHSPADELIPFSHGRRIFDGARDPKTFLQIEGSHNEGFQVSMEQYTAGWQEFLAKK